MEIISDDMGMLKSINNNIADEKQLLERIVELMEDRNKIEYAKALAIVEGLNDFDYFKSIGKLELEDIFKECSYLNHKL